MDTHTHTTNSQQLVFPFLQTLYSNALEERKFEKEREEKKTGMEGCFSYKLKTARRAARRRAKMEAEAVAALEQSMQLESAQAQGRLRAESTAEEAEQLPAAVMRVSRLGTLEQAEEILLRMEEQQQGRVVVTGWVAVVPQVVESQGLGLVPSHPQVVGLVQKSLTMVPPMAAQATVPVAVTT